MLADSAVFAPGCGDYYIERVVRFGCLCFKCRAHPVAHYAFAFQIAKDLQVFARFNPRDQRYIESVATLEKQDAYYRTQHERMLQAVKQACHYCKESSM